MSFTEEFLKKVKTSPTGGSSGGGEGTTAQSQGNSDFTNEFLASVNIKASGNTGGSIVLSPSQRKAQDKALVQISRTGGSSGTLSPMQKQTKYKVAVQLGEVERENTYKRTVQQAEKAKKEYEDFLQSEEYARMQDTKRMHQLYTQNGIDFSSGYSVAAEQALNEKERKLRTKAEELQALVDQYKMEDIMADIDNLADQAEQEYQAYIHSEDYVARLQTKEQEAIQRMAMANALGMAPEYQAALTYTEEDQKERELRTMAEYYRSLANSKKESQMMEQDLQELATWSKQEQEELAVYAANRNRDATLPAELMGANRPWTAEDEAKGIIEKYGVQRVREIAESYMRSQNQAAAQTMAAMAMENAGSGFWAGLGHSALSVGANLVGSAISPLGYLVEGGQRTGRYSTLDPNNAGQLPGVYAGAVRQEVAGNIENAGLGKGGSVAYQAGMSALDNLARLVAGGGTGSLALAAMGSFGAAVKEYSQQGVDPLKAVGMGIISGGIEVLTEKISLDNLLDEMVDPKTAGQMLKAAFKAGAVEVSEEELGLLLGTFMEAAVLREQSGYSRRVAELQAFGLTNSQAREQASMGVIEEAGQTMIQSFLSGGMMSGATSLYTNAMNRLQDRAAQKQLKATVQEAAKQIQAGENPQAKAGVGIEQGLEVDEETVKSAERIAGFTGREITLYASDEGEDGFYDPDTGIIHVNVKGADPVAQIISHELTHSVEMAEAYKEINALVMNRIRQTGGNIEQLRQEKRSQYARNGVQLKDDAAVDSEIVASYVARYLLTDEAQITSLAKENPTLAQKVKDWLDGLLAKMGNKNAQERAFTKKARDAYARALAQTGGAMHTQAESTDEGGMDMAQMKAWADEQYRSGEWDEEQYDAFLDEFQQWQEQNGLDAMAGEERRFNGARSGKKFSFAGENARTADKAALEKARSMEQQGAGRESIRQETGWFRGMDGRYRFEIDDSKMTVSDYRSNYMRLGDLIQHEELFAAYPDMADMDVVFQSLEPGINASYNPQFDSINISRSIMEDSEEIRRALVHELQHAIQNREGFTPGSNAKAWDRKIEKGYDSRRAEVRKKEREASKELSRIREEGPEFYRDMMEWEKMVPTVPRGEVDWETLEQIEEDPPEWQAFDARREELEERYGEEAVWNFDSLHYDLQQAAKNRGRTGAELYYDTAGEIEARNASDRRNLDGEGRKKTPPQLGDENTVFADVEQQIESLDAVYGPQTGEYREGTIQDAEVNEGIQQVARMDPVVAITGEEFAKGEKDLITQVDEYFTELGNTAYNEQLGDVILDRKGVKSDIAHGIGRKKAASFTAVKDVIEQGRVVDYQVNWKDRGYDTAVVAAPIMMGTQEHMAVVIMIRSRNTNRFYVHEVVTTENGAMPFKTGALKEGKPSGDAPSAFSILAKLLEVKKQAKTDRKFSIADTDGRTEAGKEREVNREDLPTKAKKILESSEWTLLNHIGKALGVPYHAKRDALKPMIQEISNEYLRTGRVSEEKMDELFEKAYEAGIVIDREFYDQYKHIKDHLRITSVTISEQDQADIADFKDFRKRAWGTLRIVKEGGLPVDSAYHELREMAPELFPERITHPADQLQKMYDVARSIQVSESSLDSYYGKYAQEYKTWQKNDFKAAVNERMKDLRAVKRYADDRIAEQEENEEITLEQAAELWASLKDARRNYEKVNAKNLLSRQDEMQVGRLLRGEILLEHLEDEENFKSIRAVYLAKQEYEAINSMLTKYKRQVRAKRLKQADGYLETAIEWKDKKTGIAYSRETMRRNIFDIIPDNPELANRIVEEYFEPVHRAEAESTRFKTQYRDRVRALNLNTKVEKGNEVSEAHAVQLLGEATDNIRVLEASRGRMKSRDGYTLQDWQGTVTALWHNNPNLDKAKIEGAVQEFRKIYNELFTEMNRVRMENGYEPVNYRNGYFPHFQPGDGDGIMQYFGRALGIDTNVEALPTTINGLTHTFKPGIQWFGNAQSRTGFKTAYDAVEGFDKYIEGVSSVIHQTENIQKLRALSTQARYRSSDEGLREQVDAVQRDTRLTDEERQMKIREIYEHGKYTLSNFVAELDEYTNLLANKKSRYDRTMEAMMGRRAYTIMKNVESRVGANMIAGNISSAVTNFIPLTQALGRVSTTDLLKGMKDARRAIVGGTNSIVGQSDFLTNRRGSDVLVKGWSDKLSNILGMPMELIDNYVSESIVRAAYYQNLRQGMTESEAIHQADIFAASVMADRSKGAMPTLFESSNPLFKAFTQFQLEVNNQYSEIFKDMPREYADRAKWVLAAAFAKYFLAAFLFNELEERVKGRRSALDPLNVGWEFVSDLWTDGIGEAGANLAVNLLEGVPFSSALTMLGVEIDGGRVPVSSAMPDIPALWEAATDKEMNSAQRWKTARDELAKPVTYLLMPVGGNQVSKMWKGIDAYIKGGSYGLDQGGNEILQYPVYKDSGKDAFVNLVKSMVFGKSALRTAQDWVENDFNSLNKYQTAVYQDMLDAGVTDRDAYGLVDEIRNVPPPADGVSEEQRRREQQKILLGSDISDDGKAVAFYGLIATEAEQKLMNALTDAGASDIIEFVIDFDDAKNLDGDGRRPALRDAIVSSNLTEEEKQVAIGNLMGTEEVTEKGSLTLYGKFLYAKEQGLTADQFMEMYAADANVEDYLDMVAAGTSSDAAYKLARDLGEIDTTDLSNTEKWKLECDVILGAGLDSKDEVAALEKVSYASTGRMVRIGYEYGVEPSVTVDFKRILPDFDANQNGSYSQKEVTAALDAISGNDVYLALTGGTARLSNEQKAVLWQLQNSQWSPERNPYDKEVGELIYSMVHAEIDAAKAEKEATTEEKKEEKPAETGGTFFETMVLPQF